MSPREQARRERARLYASARWKALRKQHLKAQPLCVHCGKRGTVADHVQGHLGNWLARFFDASGLQTLCWPCHSSKTAGAESTANGARTLQLRALGRVARGGGDVPSYSEASLSTHKGISHTQGKGQIGHRVAAALQARYRTTADPAAIAPEGHPTEKE